MKRKLGAAILAGAFLTAASLPIDALAGPGGGGRMSGATNQVRGVERIRTWDRLRLHDGFRIDPARESAGTMEKRGHTYGPGDGTGTLGARPTDGSGYGAPHGRERRVCRTEQDGGGRPAPRPGELRPR